MSLEITPPSAISKLREEEYASWISTRIVGKLQELRVAGKFKNGQVSTVELAEIYESIRSIPETDRKLLVLELLMTGSLSEDEFTSMMAAGLGEWVRLSEITVTGKMGTIQINSTDILWQILELLRATDAQLQTNEV